MFDIDWADAFTVIFQEIIYGLNQISIYDQNIITDFGQEKDPSFLSQGLRVQ